MSLAPLIDQSTTTSASATTTATANAIPSSTPSSEAASKLAEAIDDFLGDVERKFKSISDEILTKCMFAITCPTKVIEGMEEPRITG